MNWLWLGIAAVLLYALWQCRGAFVARPLPWLRDNTNSSDGGSAVIAPLFSLIDDDVNRAIEQLLKQGAEQSRNPEPLFALAIAYRRRGELDRAVTIHQSLLARPDFAQAWRDRALLELGRDYLTLGWLDRAESLLEQSMAAPATRLEAGRCLLRLHEMQRQWSQAEAWAIKLAAQGLRDDATRERVAHYRAAEAADALKQRKLARAEQLANASLSLVPDQPRAQGLLLQVACLKRDQAQVRALLDRMLTGNPRGLWLIWDAVRDCLIEMMPLAEWEKWLVEAYARYPASELALERAILLAQGAEGAQAGWDFMLEHARKQPGVHALVAMEAFVDRYPQSCAGEILAVVRAVLDDADMGRYICSNCGLRTSKVHWQCPRCSQWGQIDIL